MNTSQTKLTHQGVRDLNPKGYNAKPATCPCHRNPEIPTRVEMQLREVKTGGEIKLVGVHLCTFCGRDRGSEHDED